MPKTEKCMGCNGDKEIEYNGKKIPCPICNGKGRMPEGYAKRSGQDIVNGSYLDEQERKDKEKEEELKKNKWKM